MVAMHTAGDCFGSPGEDRSPGEPPAIHESGEPDVSWPHADPGNERDVSTDIVHVARRTQELLDDARVRAMRILADANREVTLAMEEGYVAAQDLVGQARAGSQREVARARATAVELIETAEADARLVREEASRRVADEHAKAAGDAAATVASSRAQVKTALHDARDWTARLHEVARDSAAAFSAARFAFGVEPTPPPTVDERAPQAA